MVTYIYNKELFSADENIKFSFCSIPREDDPCSNEFWELCYVYEGRAAYHTASKSGIIKENEFLLIKPGTEYSKISPMKDEGALVWQCRCIFTQAYFEALINELAGEFKGYSLYSLLLKSDPECIHLTDYYAQNIHSALWLAAYEYAHFTDGSAFIIKNTMMELLIFIMRLYENSLNQTAPILSRNSEIDELMKYIRSNFGHKLTLNFLAKQMHLSREYLSRYFKKYAGVTISEYILGVRISRAKQLLNSSSSPINHISRYCGYTSVKNFEKAFKKTVGMSPSEYRKSAKNSE